MDNQPTAQIRRFSLSPKLIFIILAVILLLELVVAIKTLRGPLPSKPATLQPLTNAKMVLISPKAIYNKGETVPVTVRLNTGGRNTNGADLILHYDPKILEASLSGIKNGNIYQEYPVKSIDPKGVIRVSGISASDGFSGIGVFTNVIFKAKQAGKAYLSLDFTKASTTDSNVVETGTSDDILDEVFNLILTVK